MEVQVAGEDITATKARRKPLAGTVSDLESLYSRRGVDKPGMVELVAACACAARTENTVYGCSDLDVANNQVV